MSGLGADRLLALLWWVVAPVINIIIFFVIAYFAKRALQKIFEHKYGVTAQPAWLLAAAVIGLAAVSVLVVGLIREGMWLDAFTLNRLLARIPLPLPLPRMENIVFPFSAYWLSGVTATLTFVYTLLAFGFAWLIAPRKPRKRKAQEEERAETNGHTEKKDQETLKDQGLPPESRSRSAFDPELGVVTALDAEAGVGAVMWLYRHLGYHGDLRQGVEPRFRLWVTRATQGLAWVKWLSVPVVGYGTTSAILWGVGALLHDGLKRLLMLPPPEESAPATEEAADETDEETAATPLGEAALVQAISSRGAPATLVEQTLSGPAEYAEHPWPREQGGPIWRQVLAGFRPYRHQLEAATRLLGGEDVLLDVLPHSGKRTIGALLAMSAPLCDAGSVLMVVDSPNAARSIKARLEALQIEGGWTAVVRVHDLSNDTEAGLDPSETQPQVLVGTVDDFEHRLMAASRLWRALFANLSLIIVADVDRYFGARTPAVASLCGRVSRIARSQGAECRFLATASGRGEGAAHLAETIVNRPLAVIDDSLNGAPKAGHSVFLIPALEGGAGIARLAAEKGWSVTTDAERLGDEDVTHEARFLPADTHDLSGLAAETRHTPPAKRAGLLVLRELVMNHPLSVALFAAGEGTFPAWLEARPLLVSGHRNPSAAARSLRRALIESEMTREELYEQYDKTIVDNELSVLEEAALLSIRDSASPDDTTGLPRATRRYRLSDPARVLLPSASDVVTNDPLTLLDDSTRQVLGRVDRVRAAAVYYPGAVIPHRDARYRVLRKGDELLAEREPEAVWTLPRRAAAIEREGWTPTRLTLPGGYEVESGQGDVVLRLEVTGARRLAPDGRLLGEQQLVEPATAVYQTRASAVYFIPDADPPTTTGAVHGVVHLARAVMPLVIRHEETDLEVILIADDPDGRIGLAVVDLHPFGAGFADAFGIGLWRRLFEKALLLADAAPGAAGDAFCKSAPGAHEAPEPAGARDLLSRLSASAGPTTKSSFSKS